jgi:hypothetical protein
MISPSKYEAFATGVPPDTEPSDANQVNAGTKVTRSEAPPIS